MVAIAIFALAYWIHFSQGEFANSLAGYLEPLEKFQT
jgi:hypothetical protein